MQFCLCRAFWRNYGNSQRHDRRRDCKCEGHARSLDTSATYTTTTDEQGAFQFIQMAPDVYRLTIEAQGFKRYTIKALQVLVDTNTSTAAVLEVEMLPKQLLWIHLNL